MARTTVFRFKGKESDPQQVGATLKLDAVVTGHIVQHGDDLTIQASLSEFRTARRSGDSSLRAR